MFKTKKDKLIVYTVLFITFLYLGIVIIQVYQENKKTYYLKVQSKLLKIKYDTSYKYFRIMADDIALMYSNNKKVINLLVEVENSDEDKRVKLRQALYSILIRNYKRLNNMGITQVHFHLPDNRSFLRMYKPEVFGDSVANIKDAVVLTNRTHTPHSGFESCQFMAGLRFVYPIFDEKKHYLGCVEIAYSTKEILKNINDGFIYDSHILISKNIATGTILEQELEMNYKKSWEHSDYYVEEATHKRIGGENLYSKLNTKKISENILKGVSSQKPFSVVTDYNYQNIIMSFFPLASANNIDNIAYIVVYTESDYLSNIKIQYHYILALFISLFGLFYLFGIYVIISQAKLKELALYDNLTKLPNRLLFNIEFTNEINRAMRYKHNIALLFLDLDGFKAVNDTYGHQAGDEVLIHVANIITARLRKNDTVSRLGGDEFTVILNDIATVDAVITIAKDIIKDINEDIIIEHKAIHVGASIGISIYPEHSTDIDKLIKYADKMMYISKQNGKNQVTIYKEKLNV